MRFKITLNEVVADSCSKLNADLFKCAAIYAQCLHSQGEERTHLCTASSSVRDASLLLPRSGSAVGSSKSSSSSSWAKEPASVAQTQQARHMLLCSCANNALSLC